jgi:hypothetical protein
MPEGMPTPQDLEDVLVATGNITDSSTIFEMTVGKILLASAYVGEQPEQLAAFINFDIDAVRDICDRLTQSGVFGAGNDHESDYFRDDDTGVVALGMDMACGLGWLERSRNDKGEPAYRMTQDGCQYVENELLPRAKGKKNANP